MLTNPNITTTIWLFFFLLQVSAACTLSGRYSDSSGASVLTDSTTERLERIEELNEILSTQDLSGLKIHKDIRPFLSDMIEFCDLKKVAALVTKCFWFVDPRLKKDLVYLYPDTRKNHIPPFYIKNQKMADLQRGIISLFFELFSHDIGFELARSLIHNGLLHWQADEIARRAIQDRALMLAKELLDEDHRPDFFEDVLSSVRLSALQEKETGIDSNWHEGLIFLLKFTGEPRVKTYTMINNLLKEYPNKKLEIIAKNHFGIYWEHPLYFLNARRRNFTHHYYECGAKKRLCKH